MVIASYLGSNLAGMISSLEPVQKFFLFYFYEATAEALENGQQIGHTLVLLAVALVAFGLAGAFFQIRNITVGAWPSVGNASGKLMSVVSRSSCVARIPIAAP